MRLPLTTLAALAAFVLAGGVRAQDAKPASAQAAADDKLSASEREERVEKSLEQMRGQATAMEKIASQARDEKDIVKLDCVNAKLNQAKGLMRISETASSDLHDADSRNDDDSSHNAFTKANIAGRKVAQLRQEAEQCIGQLAYFTDDKTRVDVEIPVGLPNTDPTDVPLPGPVESRPAPASGF